MRALAVVGAMLLLARPAAADVRLTLAPALTLEAGYDDNLFLDPTLSGARPRRGDAVIDLHPNLLGALLTRGHDLTIDVDYFERLTPSNGDIRDLLLRAAWSSPAWHRLRLTLAAVYEYYGTSQYGEDRYDLGGAEANLRLLLASAWLQLAYRAAGRGYPDPSRNGQLDVEQRAQATAHVRLHPLLALDGGYGYWHVSSNEPTAALDRHRFDASLTLRPLDWLSLAAGYSLWLQRLPHGGDLPQAGVAGGARSDVAQAASFGISARPRPWLELFARYDLIVSRSDGSFGRYQLDQVVAGVGADWGFAHEVKRPPPLLPLVHDGVVTFRARAHRGARVAVVGDWNGWQPQPLAATGGDRFAGSFVLPPGRHAWSLSVDGSAVTPPEAEGWADDGFGGKNALVTVP